jgi:hypothetical protein
MNSLRKLAFSFRVYGGVSINRQLVSLSQINEINKLDKNLITTQRKLNIINSNSKPTQEDVCFYFLLSSSSHKYFCSFFC